MLGWSLLPAPNPTEDVVLEMSFTKGVFWSY